MRNSLFCTLLQLSALLSTAAVSAAAQSPQPAAPSTVTVSFRPYKDARPIVAVMINGAGPYDLMVDTGATATTLDAQLFDELGLKSEGAAKVGSVAGDTLQTLSTVKEISLNGLTVPNLLVLKVDSLPFGSQYRGVRGILGENFLHHFDLLLDNQRRTLTLDAGGTLAGSFDGERLPITFPEYEPTMAKKYHPMVTVKVPAFSSRPVTVLLDSGADNLILIGGSAIRSTSLNNAIQVKTVTGSMSCAATRDELRWGRASVNDVALVACQSDAKKPSDHDGTMPTSLFPQIFISHAGSYAIVNPKKRAHVTQVAALTPPAL